jgi:predicted DNA-binding WGR domain protein
MPTALQKIRNVTSRLRENHSYLQEGTAGPWLRRYEYKGSNYKNQSGHSSKFWEITWEQVGHVGKIVTRWGKIGSKGQTKMQYGSLYKAKDMASAKSVKGYSLVKTGGPGPQMSKPKKKAAPKPKKREGRSLAALIKRATSHTKPEVINTKKPTAPKKVGHQTKLGGLQGPPIEKGAGKKLKEWKKRLEYSGSNYKNQSGYSSKFYLVTVKGSTVTYRWGKIGSHGQTKIITKGSHATASAFAKAQIAKKKAKGYKQV